MYLVTCFFYHLSCINIPSICKNKRDKQFIIKTLRSNFNYFAQRKHDFTLLDKNLLSLTSNRAITLEKKKRFTIEKHSFGTTMNN